jgi:hypothetical protein
MTIPAPAIAHLRMIAEEIHTAGGQLAALVEEDLEIWQTDVETDLLGLRLKMAEWSRLLEQAATEIAL